MLSRTELHDKLTQLLGSRNVYYQPPEGLKLKYPCIIYELNDVKTNHANNLPYDISKAYSITVVDEDPDSEIADRMLTLPLCKFVDTYTSQGLNHYKFTLFHK